MRSASGPAYVEVLFLESARIYRLDAGRAGFDDALRTLQDAEARGSTVVVALESIDSDVIEDVRTPGVAPPAAS